MNKNHKNESLGKERRYLLGAIRAEENLECLLLELADKAQTTLHKVPHAHGVVSSDGEGELVGRMYTNGVYGSSVG